MCSTTKTPSALLQRSWTKEYPEAVGGDGVYVKRSDGSRIMDGCCGAAVSCLGHNDREVIDAIVKQAQNMPFVHGSFFTNQPAEGLAQHLMRVSNGVFSKAVFMSSGLSLMLKRSNDHSYTNAHAVGSEAVETALKLAYQYHLSRGEPHRTKFLARHGSYHGNTIGALSAGFNPQRRDVFKPLLSQAFHHVPACFFSRDALSGESEAAYVDRLMIDYEATFQQLGPEEIAAVIVEPVVGATLGAVPACDGYLSRLRQLCDAHGALLIFDEVMCGLGRIGTTHAWQSTGNMPPDLQTVGKGLATGYQPISGVLITSKVLKSIAADPKGRPFVNGHTYQAHPVACAAALATQKSIERRDLLRNVFEIGVLLKDELESLPRVREVRGRGLFLAVEFEAGLDAASVAAACLALGLAVYLCSSMVNAVIVAPPFIMSKEQALQLVDILRGGISSVR